MDRRVSTPPQLSGRAFLSGTRILYIGSLVATKRHAHHATQIMIAPQGVDIEDGANGRVRAYAAVIPPRMRHGHSASAHAAFMLLDGDEVASRELSRNAAPRCETWVHEKLNVTIPSDPTAEQARGIIAAIFSALDLREQPAPRHPAARRMCTYLDGVEDDVDLASLSQRAGLSPRQMRHAFARDVGLPMRAYMRWKRLRRAIAAVEEGANLSAAAVAAGFADSAHLSRVFREHFGMAPSQGLRTVTWQTLD